MDRKEVAIARLRIVLLVVVAALTIGVGVTWAATRGSSTPSSQPPATTPSTTAPVPAAQHDGNCPHMGGSGSGSTAYSSAM